jgi:putative FmdB family regulatory protein
MPIYEYRCNKCGVFEAMQGIKEAPLKKCPTCKSKVERQISRGSFILKGSGWYATDYAKKSTPASTDSDSSASSAATPATNGSTDSSSKPASDSKPASESKSSSSEAKAPSKSKSSSSEKSVSAKSAD